MVTRLFLPASGSTMKHEYQARLFVGLNGVLERLLDNGTPSMCVRMSGVQNGKTHSTAGEDQCMYTI